MFGVKLTRPDVESYLKVDGVWLRYTNWVCHGEAPLVDTMYVEMTEVEDQLHTEPMDDMLHELQDTESQQFDADQEPNSKARAFYSLLEDAETPLYLACQNTSKMSKLSFLLKLLHIKMMNKVTGACMDMLIDFIREMLPEGAHVPRSWYEAKKSITELGLGYQKIDACKNDCVLF